MIELMFDFNNCIYLLKYILIQFDLFDDLIIWYFINIIGK